MRGDRRAGALAGAEALERPADRVGVEAEVGEQRARLGLVDARRGVAAEPRQQRAGGGEVLRALREQAHARRRPRPRRALGAQRAEQQLQQRRLARAVGAGDRDALAAVEREVDVAQHAGADARVAARATRRPRSAAASSLRRTAGASRGRSTQSVDAHLALEPALARLRLLRDLLGVALDACRRPGRWALRSLRRA